MHGLDFSSWQTVVSTLLAVAVVTLIGVGIRLLAMLTIQQRRERENRQINERLRTLIAAYKTLGGSFTGNLMVDPRHLRDLRRARADAAPAAEEAALVLPTPTDPDSPGADRARRIRDAVEAALSDILLLGTDEQVRLAARAAGELAAGKPIHTAELVVSLRDFIRRVLDLAPVPAGLEIPAQGPTRPASSRGGKSAEGGRGGARGGGGAAGAGGSGMGVGLALRGEAGTD